MARAAPCRLLVGELGVRQVTGYDGLNAGLFRDYVRYSPDRRLERIGLAAPFRVPDPFPRMSEAIDLRKQENLFGTTVTQYQSASAPTWGLSSIPSVPCFGSGGI
jgi:ribonucleotide reductase beta subunit family protein with ferritin-like domain